MAANTAIDAGRVNNNADDDEEDEEDETHPKQNSFKLVHAEILKQEDAQKQTTEKATCVGHVSDLMVIQIRIIVQIKSKVL